MSLRDVTVSTSARRRIRSFSVALWVFGSVLLFVSALNTYENIGLGDDGFAVLGEDEYPWDAENPPVFEADGNVYSGDGSGVIRIPLEEHNGEPLTVQLEAGEYVDLFVTRPEDLNQPANDRYYPDNVAYMYEPDDEAFVLPARADLELWVRTEGEWSFTLAPADVREITDGYASGKGDQLLIYRGDAVSARFEHAGAGVFFVTIQTPGSDRDQPIIESGDVSERLSWDPADSVFFTIESDAERGVWTVDIDELASDSPEQPTPPPSDTPPAEPAEPASSSTRGTP